MFRTGIHTLRIRSKIESLVTEYTHQGRFSGAILVAQKGEVLFTKGYGLANREYNCPNTPQTLFRIGSMTKPFTAIAIMQLVEAGKLTLTEPVTRYFPGVAGWNLITVRHLLSNTSGIEDFISMPEYVRQMGLPLTLDDLIALFKDHPLRFEPGTRFDYSNSNWVLLGAILEHLTSQSYSDAIHNRIFQPAGMAHSGYDWSAPILKNRAQGYNDTGTVVLNAEAVHEDAMRAAGALYSTVEDLYRWDRALQSEMLLKANTLTEMFTPHDVTEGGHYGLGWEIRSEFGHRWVGHSGGMPGFTANIARFVDDQLTIIVLSNLGGSAWEKIHHSLAAIVFDQPYALSPNRNFVTLDTETLRQYTGVYELSYLGRTHRLRFELDREVLTMSVLGLPTAVLFPLGNHQFYARSKGEVELTFVHDDKGTFPRLEVLWSGAECHGQRI